MAYTRLIDGSYKAYIRLIYLFSIYFLILKIAYKDRLHKKGQTYKRLATLKRVDKMQHLLYLKTPAIRSSAKHSLDGS